MRAELGRSLDLKSVYTFKKSIAVEKQIIRILWGTWGSYGQDPH